MKYFVWTGASVMLSAASVVVAEPPVERAAEAKAPSAAEKLKTCEALYAGAKTYQDTGEVKTEFTVSDEPVKTISPFLTAFERDGRFLWQFEHSTRPGDNPDNRYTVWSADQKAFKSLWTFNRSRNDYDTIDLAMAGATGISGGSATAVIPLLVPTMRWGVRVTDLKDAAEKPAETIEKTPCSVIAGQDRTGSAVTLWLDSSMAIRRIRTVREVDPAKIPGATPGPKFTVTTTISITPVLDGKIADDRFVPPAAE